MMWDLAVQMKVDVGKCYRQGLCKACVNNLRPKRRHNEAKHTSKVPGVSGKKLPKLEGVPKGQCLIASAVPIIDSFMSKISST